MIEWEKSVVDGNIETRHGRAGKLKFSIKVMEYREFGNPDKPLQYLVEINYQLGSTISWPYSNTLNDCKNKEEAFTNGMSLIIQQLQHAFIKRSSETIKLEEALAILTK